MSGVPRQNHCRADGCTDPRAPGRRGYCGKHYKRVHRHGDASVTARAVSTPGITPSMKAEYVANYKLDHGCVDCGYNEYSCALDFDHRPGTVKVRDIKSGQQLGWQALLDEIAKCDVVCANCHRVRTWLRLNKDVIRERS